MNPSSVCCAAPALRGAVHVQVGVVDAERELHAAQPGLRGVRGGGQQQQGQLLVSGQHVGGEEALQFRVKLGEQPWRETPEVHRDRLVAGQCLVTLSRAGADFLDLEHFDDVGEPLACVHFIVIR